MAQAKRQFFWVPGPLPGLNEVIDAAHVTYGRGNTRFSEYRKMKRSWGERIQAYALSQRLEPIESAEFHYLCVETSRRRDPSNITAGALKLIEDGLQDAGVLKNDGWSNVLSIQVSWTVGEYPGVMLGVGQQAPTLAELVARLPGLTAAG